MKQLNKVVIFGATSAIAEQVARQFVARGASVFCVGRDPDKLKALVQDLTVRATAEQKIEGKTADLLNTDKHASLIREAEAALGGIDGALIAHGALPDQKACEASFAMTQKQIETNALSVISLLIELANYLEKQQSGVIAGISSVAGDRGRQSNYVYGAAKGMVTIFMQGLRNRLARNHVDVVTIKPGFVDTPMTAELDKSGLLWAKPDKVAAGIVDAMIKGKDEVYLPKFWRGIMFVVRHLPERIFKRLSL